MQYIVYTRKPLGFQIFNAFTAFLSSNRVVCRHMKVTAFSDISVDIQQSLSILNANYIIILSITI